MDKGLFKKPNVKLEINGVATAPISPENIFVKCENCKSSIVTSVLEKNLFVCPKCNAHHKISARKRMEIIADENTFIELFADIVSTNRLNFPNYDEKLEKSALESGEKEAVITGECKINGYKTCIFFMECKFMMGSMGSAVGEKITRLFEYATTNNLAVIGFTASGGARMQEGILSLMQMAKTSQAVKRHSESRNLYISILCDPTTGGVTASFAMEADIILAEPNALIAFAGPRVIEQTIRQKLPITFQKSEFLYEKGFIDKIITRNKQREFLGKMLKIHSKVGE